MKGKAKKRYELKLAIPSKELNKEELAKAKEKEALVIDFLINKYLSKEAGI
ncbi:hypothetical protein [Mechercharimyces sp. CAU 1602]|uniref:hypothetical protein n=1 Tax=Mechercharimyces sp. CAU 1602 TaxID=2973933 RepID=UPI0021614997|nr:hypothetical protein [Mechercharimyces sp. CAU 1602]MCS1350375.1 hypothetical protein [Mechercharimyces sp. CAU 1602]